MSHENWFNEQGGHEWDELCWCYYFARVQEFLDEEFYIQIIITLLQVDGKRDQMKG